MDAVETYFAIFAEPEPARRRALIEANWAPDASITLGERRIENREALIRQVEAFRAAAPEDQPRLAGPVRWSGNWFAFDAEIRRPDGSVYNEVTDVGELAPDGRIARMVTFAR
jgi:hypothetical protein